MKIKSYEGTLTKSTDEVGSRVYGVVQQCPKIPGRSSTQKNTTSDLQVLSTFVHSQKGCAGQGELQAPQHNKSPALVTLPFIPGQEEPPQRGCLWLSLCWDVGVTAPRPFCEPVTAQNPSPAGNKSCLEWCSTPAPSCCCCSWLYFIKRFRVIAPFTCFWIWGEKRSKNCKGAPPMVLQSPAVWSRVCWTCRVPVSAPSFHHRVTLAALPLPLPVQQHWPLGIPRAGLGSRQSGTYPCLYTTQPFPAIKLILYVQPCFGN